MMRRLSAELTVLSVVVETMVLQQESGGFPMETLFPDVVMLAPLFPSSPLVVLGYSDSIIEGLLKLQLGPTAV